MSESPYRRGWEDRIEAEDFQKLPRPNPPYPYGTPVFEEYMAGWVDADETIQEEESP